MSSEGTLLLIIVLDKRNTKELMKTLSIQEKVQNEINVLSQKKRKNMNSQ